MSNPTICAIMLTKDRPEMAARAVRCFREQTYENKRLLIWDTGSLGGRAEDSIAPIGNFELQINEHYCFDVDGFTIGKLRNRANSWPEVEDSDIIAHWDSDDYSHPNRLTEQVALLVSSGADAVGFNSMLFWDTRVRIMDVTSGGAPWTESALRNEAWLYCAVNPQHILGTSLLYWRSTWERQPFDDVPSGEDTRWIAKLGKKAFGVPSDMHHYDGEPRMIASVHGGNSSGYAPEKDRASTKRAPEFDAFCRTVMAL